MAVSRSNVECLVLKPPRIAIREPIVLTAPRASEKLAAMPARSDKVAMMVHLLDLGADAHDLSMGSATLKLIEKQIATFDDQLEETLSEALDADREKIEEKLEAVLKAHDSKVSNLVRRYFDPGSTEGVQETVGRRLDQVGKEIVKRVRKLLEDGEEGIVSGAVKEIRGEIREATAEIVRQIGARHAISNRSALAGRPFEEAVTQRIADLCHLTGDRVTPIGDTLGVLRRKIGDVLVEVDAEITNGETLRIVVEAKKRDGNGGAFTARVIAEELRAARRNREAHASVFVAQGMHMLPRGIPFGQVSDADFYTVYNPEEGDDLGLACAIRLARFAALKSVAVGASIQVDIKAATAAIGEVHQHLNALGSLTAHHEKVRRILTQADEEVAAMREAILVGLRKVDHCLAGQ